MRSEVQLLDPILAPGQCMVATLLEIMTLSREKSLHVDYRMLGRAVWSSRAIRWTMPKGLAHPVTTRGAELPRLFGDLVLTKQQKLTEFPIDEEGRSFTGPPTRSLWDAARLIMSDIPGNAGNDRL
jgi:hypothetical protein